jgi:hypothetical protein
MTKQELTDYWQGLTKEANLPDDKAKAVLEVLSDEAVSEAFTKGFRTAPEYNRGLDKNRADWEEKLTAAEETKARLTKWYNETAEPAYKQNAAGVAELKRYIDRYGTLDDSTNGAEAASTNGNPTKDVLTRAELEEMLKSRDQAVSSVVKQAMRISTEHVKRFDEPLSNEALAEVEGLVTEHGISLADAYERWTAPRIKEQETEALKAKFEKEKAEAVADALSKHNLPVETKAPEHNIFFNPDKPDSTMSADEQARHQRDEFAAGWNQG